MAKRTASEVSTEEFTIGTIAAAGFLAVLWGFMAWDAWRTSRKTKKEFENSAVGQAQKTIQEIRNTYANDSWLKKQTFLTSPVNVAGASVFLVNNQVPDNVLASIGHFVSVTEKLNEDLGNVYRQYADKINKLIKPIEQILMILTPEKLEVRSLEEKNQNQAVYEKVNQAIAQISHPMVERWVKLPDYRTIPGNFSYAIDDKHDQFYESYYVIKEMPAVKVKTLPALTQEQVKEVSDLIIKITELVKTSKRGLFGSPEQVLYSLPAPQDGWPYDAKIMIDEVFKEDYNGPLYQLGALAEQAYDPIFHLEWKFEQTYLKITDALLKWIHGSISQ